MTLKPITIRLPEDDLELARTEAEALGISVGVYLRMLFRQSLRTPLDPLKNRQGWVEALRYFGEILSGELEDISQEDALRLAKSARKRLAAECSAI